MKDGEHDCGHLSQHSASPLGYPCRTVMSAVVCSHCTRSVLAGHGSAAQSVTSRAERNTLACDSRWDQVLVSGKSEMSRISWRHVCLYTRRGPYSTSLYKRRGS